MSSSCHPDVILLSSSCLLLPFLPSCLNLLTPPLQPDLAYTLTSPAVISVPTATVFPGRRMSRTPLKAPMSRWLSLRLLHPGRLQDPANVWWKSTVHCLQRRRQPCPLGQGDHLSSWLLLPLADLILFLTTFPKVARRLVFIYKSDGGGGKQRLRFKLKLGLNK